MPRSFEQGVYLYTEDGNRIICDEGCEFLCSECRAELAGDASKAYIGSGEDAPAAFRKSNDKKIPVMEL